MGNIINHPSILHKNNTNSLEFSSPKKLGLAIINSLTHETKTFEETLFNHFSTYNNKKGSTFFVPKLIKIKDVPTLSLSYCPKKATNVAPKEIIEMSEEYTRITFHSRPQSETTHLFGDCVLECRPKEFVFPGNCSYNGETIAKQAYINDGFASDSAATITPFFESGFLRTCYACNKSLAGYDIYMYRGDASFWSTECRFQEVMADKHNETMRKKIEKLGKKKMMMNNEEQESYFPCRGKGLK